jgi:hypothetical protein
MNNLLLDLHGNALLEGDLVQNRAGYLAEIANKNGRLVVKYDSGHCYYLDDGVAVGLTKIANPELFLLGKEY